MQEKMTAAEFQAKYGRKTSAKPVNAPSGPYSNVKAGWYNIAGLWIYFRAGWEYKFALILEEWVRLGIIESWQHEPRFFEFAGERHGVTRYKPDFCAQWRERDYLTWYEVKGRLNSGDQKKMRLFRKYYPGETLILIDQKWFKQQSQYKALPGWNQMPIKKKSLLPADAQFRSAEK